MMNCAGRLGWKSHLFGISLKLLLLISATEGFINFEIVNNYLGEAIIYYDQEVANSTNMTSYGVNSMMACRRIKNASDTPLNPLNIVSVGTYENGTIACKIGYSHLSTLKLAPKPGMVTYLSRIANAFSPSKSGIFFYTSGNQAWTSSNDAATYCIGNWELSVTITPTLMNELISFMAANSLFYVTVGATTSSNGSTWVDGTPFNYPIINSANTGPWMRYYNGGQGNAWFQSVKGDEGTQVVCMLNIFSTPWKEFKN